LFGARLQSVRLHQLRQDQTELHAPLRLGLERTGHLGGQRRVGFDRQPPLREILAHRRLQALDLLLEQALRRSDAGPINQPPPLPPLLPASSCFFPPPRRFLAARRAAPRGFSAPPPSPGGGGGAPSSLGGTSTGAVFPATSLPW